MKKFTIDRIEEGKAVLECENGDMVNLDVASLPKNIKEGDILEFADGSYFLDDEETSRRKKKIKELMSSLFEE
ncbi:MAG: DUF3006 domain-containing protein [Ruminococcus sp.]|nr:DUF3006 domain-containing protein [Ruminococcus sp.]